MRNNVANVGDRPSVLRCLFLVVEQWQAQMCRALVKAPVSSITTSIASSWRMVVVSWAGMDATLWEKTRWSEMDTLFL